MAHTSGSKLSTSESVLKQKKQEILAKSMAIFDRQLDTWLEQKFSEPMRRVGMKRARSSDSDHDSGVEDGGRGNRTTTTRTTKTEVGSGSNTKKRAKREPKAAAVVATAASAAPAPPAPAPAPATAVRLFACPFYANNPAKFKAVKTCCGPGWNSTHRLKEHIYRRHCLKHTCPRCFEEFKNDEELNRHQRQEIVCKVKKNHGIDAVITDEQEKQIHARAKTKQPEEERWRELYRIIFPEANKRIPSPYYDTATLKSEDEPSPLCTTKPRASSSSRSPSSSSSLSAGPASLGAGGSVNEYIQFENEAQVRQCKEHIHRGLHRVVLPVLEQEVDKLMRSVQTAMTAKVTELCNNLVTKVFRTWQFGNSQSVSPSPAPSRGPSRGNSPSLAPSLERQRSAQQSQSLVGAGAAYESQSPRKMGPTGQQSLDDLSLSYDELLAEPSSMLGSLLTDNGDFDLGQFLAEIQNGTNGSEFDLGCVELLISGSASDSAYFTGSVDGSESVRYEEGLY